MGLRRAGVVALVGLAVIAIGSSTGFQRARQGPGGVTSGLVLWLRSDKGVTAERGMVSEWADVYDDSQVASQSDGSLMPVIARIGDLPVLLFRDARLDFDGTLLVGTDYTVIIVDVKRVERPFNYYFGGTSTAQNENAILGYSSMCTISHTHLADSLDGAIDRAPTGQFAWTAFVVSETDGRWIFWNGTEVASDSAARHLESFEGATLGYVDSLSHDYNGYLAEVAIFSRALAADEIEKIAAYMDARYPVIHKASDSAADEPRPGPPYAVRVRSSDIFCDPACSTEWCEVNNILGAPDDRWVYLGDVGGEIAVKMGRPIVDGPGEDLLVYEISYAERFDVFVSENGTSWVKVASSIRKTSAAQKSVGVDISGHTGTYWYVKIVEAQGDLGCNSPGSDIDAIEVLNTR